MKTFERWLGICLVVLASAGLLVACGGEAAECLDDSDCAEGQLCDFEAEECAFECTTTDDCEAGEECVERTNDTGMICVTTDTGGNNPSDTCETTEDCDGEQVCEAGFCEDPCTAGECGEGFVCNTDTGICEDEGAGASYRFIRVLDDSSGADACDNSDPGSDILGVEVQTDDGSFWGKAIYTENIVTDGNDHADADAILTGNPPGLTDDCPENNAFSGHVVALGCGGSVIVEFEDGDQPVFLSEGDQVIVYEYGAACEGSAADEWLAEVCTVQSEDDVILDGSCDGIELGGASGTVQLEIPAE